MNGGDSPEAVERKKKIEINKETEKCILKNIGVITSEVRMTV